MKKFLNTNTGPPGPSGSGTTSLTLADKMRPSSLDDYFGQEELVAPGAMLRSLLDRDAVPSMILWGPPGVGKTTLANIIAAHTKSHFIKLSAVTSGVPKLKEVIEEASNHKKYKQHTIVFVDEIHRFNKLQQDALLPHVESGVITLIGATTENPSFECNAALLSRAKVFVLKKLSVQQVSELIHRGMQELHKLHPSKSHLTIEDDAVSLLANICDGDARVPGDLQTVFSGLSGLEMAFMGTNDAVITTVAVQQAFQRTHVTYDKNGEQHYNIISALHKSLRGSDVDASIYWMVRMLEGGEDPKYIARRFVRFASEDIGLADPQALVQANAAAYAVQFVGMPECSVHLMQAAVYMAKAPKSNELYEAYNRARDLVRSTPTYPVPLHICNAPTKLMTDLGCGAGYKYNHNFDEPVEQTYFPAELLGTKLWEEKPAKYTGSARSTTPTLPVTKTPNATPPSPASSLVKPHALTIHAPPAAQPNAPLISSSKHVSPSTPPKPYNPSKPFSTPTAVSSSLSASSASSSPQPKQSSAQMPLQTKPLPAAATTSFVSASSLMSKAAPPFSPNSFSPSQYSSSSSSLSSAALSSASASDLIVPNRKRAHDNEQDNIIELD